MRRLGTAPNSEIPPARALLVALALLAAATGNRILAAETATDDRSSREAAAPPSSGIAGKVLLAGAPAAGLHVYAFTDAGTNFAEGARTSFGPTGEDGRFTLSLEPGRYFLLARGAGADAAGADRSAGELFGYYGGNPVKVRAGSITEVNLQTVRRAPVIITQGEGPNVVIAGAITGPRGPEGDAALFAYPDAKSDFRGPDLTGPLGSLAGGSAPDGSFSVELPPGTYYLTAAKRKGGAALGPLHVGDLFGYFDGNPLRLQAGQEASVTVQMTERLRQTEPPAAAGSGATGVRGRLLDPSGRAVPGVFAFASTDPNLFGAMPPHRSQPAGADGGYYIELPRGGTYYLGARTGFGGVPLPGQWLGMLGETSARPVTIETGKIAEDVDITVRLLE